VKLTALLRSETPMLL